MFANEVACVLNHLPNLMNKLLQTGTFPTCVKTAMINDNPLHKWGDKDQASKYRPIAPLATLSKIEKLVI